MRKSQHLEVVNKSFRKNKPDSDQALTAEHKLDYTPNVNGYIQSNISI